MKKKNITIPSRSQYSVLRQICDLIPPDLVPKLAKETGVDKKARTVSPWSHLVRLIYAQLTHAIFLGHSANAVRWQIWTALQVYVLLRFLAFVNGWHHTFTRIFTLLRSALWRRWDLTSLLQSYGTASGSFRFIPTPWKSRELFWIS